MIITFSEIVHDTRIPLLHQSTIIVELFILFVWKMNLTLINSSAWLRARFLIQKYLYLCNGLYILITAVGIDPCRDYRTVGKPHLIYLFYFSDLPVPLALSSDTPAFFLCRCCYQVTNQKQYVNTFSGMYS